MRSILAAWRIPSGTAEPVVALVLPVAARILVREIDRGDVLRILEAELGRDAELHREAEHRREDLVGEPESEQGLGVQRGGHVYARVVLVRTLEPDVFRGKVGADALQKVAEAHAAPFADRAPPLDADVARHLGYLRKRVELR